MAVVPLVAPATSSAWKGYYSFLEGLGTHTVETRSPRSNREGARGVSAQTVCEESSRRTQAALVVRSRG
eukprot:2229116-Pyramimonas_sp.AAC.1